MIAKRITNFNYFVDILDRNWKYAYKMFQKADEAETIVSNYDDEGFCTFKRIKEGVYEFTGTAR